MEQGWARLSVEQSGNYQIRGRSTSWAKSHYAMQSRRGQDRGESSVLLAPKYMAQHAVLAPFGAHHKRVNFQVRRSGCHSWGSMVKREFIRQKVNKVEVSKSKSFKFWLINWLLWNRRWRKSKTWRGKYFSSGRMWLMIGVNFRPQYLMSYQFIHQSLLVQFFWVGGYLFILGIRSTEPRDNPGFYVYKFGC